MFKLFLIINCTVLIGLIFVRVPQENAGLTSFATKTSFISSASSGQKFLNISTSIGIILYFILAISGHYYQ